MEGEELNESTSPTEEATVEEPTSSKITIDYGGKSREFEPEVFNKIVDAYDKGQKWETSYHKKGESLNKLREQLYSQQKEVDENKKLLEEYRKIKQAFEANPTAYAAVQKALNESDSVIPPAYKELEKKTHQLEQDMAYDKAVRELSKEIDDFDENTIRNFSYNYDVNNVRDNLTLYYNAWKGSQIDDLIEKAKTQVVLDAKQKKGLPPIGQKITPPKEFPSKLQDQYREALKRIDTEGAKF